jgi:hypothetical protein
MKYDENFIKNKGYFNLNHISRRYYMGESNQKKLTEAGFTIPERLTFNQARKNGLKIKA